MTDKQFQSPRAGAHAPEKKKRFVLIACEESQVEVSAWRAAGFIVSWITLKEKRCICGKSARSRRLITSNAVICSLTKILNRTPILILKESLFSD